MDLVHLSLRHPRVRVVLGAMWLLLGIAPLPITAAPCRRCGWDAPSTAYGVTVHSLPELRDAVQRARPGTTIRLADGVYRLDRMLDLPVPDLVLRGRSGDRSRVAIVGRGLDEHEVGVALSVSAPRVTLADLTVGSVGLHAVQVRGEKHADRLTLHNVRVLDAGQQLLKGSMGQDNRGLAPASSSRTTRRATTPTGSMSWEATAGSSATASSAVSGGPGTGTGPPAPPSCSGAIPKTH
jgi:hypothetical protein